MPVSINLQMDLTAPRDVFATPWDSLVREKRKAVNANRTELAGGQREGAGTLQESQNRVYRRWARSQLLWVDRLLDCVSNPTAVSSSSGEWENGV